MASCDFTIPSAPQDMTVGSGSISTFALDEAADRIEYIFQAPEACTIQELGYLYGARTGTPPTYSIQLEGVNLTTGRSDGTIKASSNAKKTFTPPASTADDGLWKWPGTLTSNYTCTRGEDLAIVLTYASGTVNGTNFSTFSNGGGGAFPDANFPYVNSFNNTGSVLTRRTSKAIFGYRSSTKTYGFPFQQYNQAAFSLDSTPDEYALRFMMPSGFCSTFQVGYIELYGIPPTTANKSFKVNLYSGTTVLQSVTRDADAMATNSTRLPMRCYFNDSSLATLSANTVYRVGIQPQETTNNMQVTQFQVSANSDFSAWPMGIEWYMSTRTDLGSWTDITTKRPRIDLGIVDVTGGSGGGLLRNPGMTGGMD